MRNLLFDLGILPSKTFDIPIICIGNLSFGGTGKTPLTDYIISLLGENKVAVLSRGYGRNTKGYLEISKKSSAEKVGDEPLQQKQKHPNCLVVVDEYRKRAIEKILKTHPEIDVILLDDAFQHRGVKAGFNILITDYNLPYYKDYLLPMGTLRESKRGSERADIIVVSKSPTEINPTEKKGIIQQLGVFITQKCYFSHINYKNWKCITTNEVLSDDKKYRITLVTGIANATPLIENLKENGHSVIMDYTLGEIVVETHVNSTTILTQGFHQGVLEVHTGVVNIDIKTKVYPNPTTNFLIIELEKNVNADILVYDINGKIVIKDRLDNEQQKQLDFSFLTQGNYFLHINIADKESVYQINKSK